MGSNPAKVYMHPGIGNDTNACGFSGIGNYGSDDGIGLMTNNGDGIWSITITPSTYYNINATQQVNATKLGMVIRDANGSQSLKLAPACSDFIFNVGTFQANLTAPANTNTTIINSGGNLNIAASNTNGAATCNLLANGISINTANTQNYFFNHTKVVSNQTYELQIAQGTSTITRKFSVIVILGQFLKLF